MPGTIVSFDRRDDFKAFIRQHRFVIVKATAGWCGPCKRIRPLVDALFSELPSDVHMVVTDVDKHSDLASYLRVRSVPSLYNFIDGCPQDSLAGADTKKVEAFFRKTLERSTGGPPIS